MEKKNYNIRLFVWNNPDPWKGTCTFKAGEYLSTKSITWEQAKKQASEMFSNESYQGLKKEIKIYDDEHQVLYQFNNWTNK